MAEFGGLETGLNGNGRADMLVNKLWLHDVIPNAAASFRRWRSMARLVFPWSLRRIFSIEVGLQSVLGKVVGQVYFKGFWDTARSHFGSNRIGGGRGSLSGIGERKLFGTGERGVGEENGVVMGSSG